MTPPPALVPPQAFVWIGAPLQMVLTVMTLAALVIERHSAEHINPAIIITPVGNLVAALALVNVDADYLEGAYFWCVKGPVALTAASPERSHAAASRRPRPGGPRSPLTRRPAPRFPLQVWHCHLSLPHPLCADLLQRMLPAFAGKWCPRPRRTLAAFSPPPLGGLPAAASSLAQGVLTHNSDDRQRVLMWIWLAAPAVSLVTYLTLESQSVRFCWTRGGACCAAHAGGPFAHTQPPPPRPLPRPR